jgi:PAS domain S-box-containing protein
VFPGIDRRLRSPWENALQEKSPQGVCALDPRGVVLHANTAMLGLLGREEDGVVSRSIFELLSTDEAVTLKNQLGKLFQDAGDAVECRIERPDGSRRVCLRQATPVRDDAGDHVGWLTFWSDITTSHRDREQLRLLEVASNAVDAMISVIDERGIVRLVNDAWCRGTRVARRDVIGRHVRKLPPEAFIPERRQDLVDCLVDRRMTTARLRIDLPGRGPTDLRIDFYPFGDDLFETRHALVVTSDVSATEDTLRALRQGDAERRAVLDIFPGYIAAIEQDLRYSYVNAATAARLGSTPERIIGRHAREVMGEESFLRMMGTWWPRLEAGQRVVEDRDYPAEHGLPKVRLQVTRVAGRKRMDGGQTFYSFGVDVQDPLRARRDMDLVIARKSRAPAAAAKDATVSDAADKPDAADA